MNADGNDGTGGDGDSSPAAASDDHREGDGGDEKKSDGNDGCLDDENELEMRSGGRPSSSSPTTTTTTAATEPKMKIVRDRSDLLRRGICRVSINGDEHDDDRAGASHSPPPLVDLPRWSAELSRVTPEILTAQSDGEYAFYRNIMEDDPPFPPIREVLRTPRFVDVLRDHFGVHDPEGELRLDDAFCVHYDVDSQADTGGALHLDPSDITVNMCLERGDGVRGSEVMFIGTKSLKGIPLSHLVEGGDGDGHGEGDEVVDEEVPRGEGERFLVEQLEGYATVHWGDHPHQTMPMLRAEDENGDGVAIPSSGAGNRRRTNVILTYCYRDSSRSDVATRSCYFVE